MADASISPLLNAIEGYEQSCNRNSDLSKERVSALNAYLGKPYGNEIEGRSQVVSHDTQDTIEWIMPSLMRIFASGDDVVSFDPRGPEDVDQAQQESDYTNYILTQKNPWFRTSYVWFKDALMQKNGYVKAWYEQKKDVTEEKYEGITQPQLQSLLVDPEVEIMDLTEAPLVGVEPMFNVKLKRTNSYGCVKYKEIPPERTLVSQWASSIDLEDVDFFEHFEWQTLSEIKAAGLDMPEMVGDEASSIRDEEEEARNLYGEVWQDGDETNDPALKRYKVREIWIRFDDNDDGIAELLHCIYVGRNELLKEECEFNPAAAITPNMMPHRHVGRSVFDAVGDLQEIKTALLRGTLDNMYLGLNGRTGIDERKVNLDDMLTSRPGGIVRTDGPPANSLMPFQHPNMMQDGLAAIEYIDQIKQNRTGVTAYMTSVDQNVLNKTATGTNLLQNAAMAKIELIARVFAETGVKRLMWLIHALSLKHARKAEVVRLRNQWVEIDPRNWKKRYDMTVSVGLGTGNRDQQLLHLQNILGLQEKLMMIGLATKKTIRHAASKYVQAAGFKDNESFLPPAPQPGPDGQDPEDQPIQMPQQPDPAQAEMVKQKAEHERTAATLQADQQKTQAQIQADQQTTAATLQAEQQKAAAELMAQERLETIRQAGENERERMRIESAERIAHAKIVSEESKARFNAEHAERVKGAEIASKERQQASRTPA